MPFIRSEIAARYHQNMVPKDRHRAQSQSGDMDALVPEDVELEERGHTAAETLLPGEVVADRFVVVRRVGSGGMGTIHLASDRFTHEAVAIKVMASGRSSDANRFALEARVLAELSHPAVVRHVAHGLTAGGAPYLAMEWLEGEDLAVRLARAPLTVDESLRLLQRACEGVAFAHARGVVHRDLKPSNLFLVNGEPSATKVLDFGIARRTEGTRTLTQSGTVLGTVGYMAPEQARGRSSVDARADVFALGCLLFECLTGRAAFVGPNALAVLAKVLCDDPPLVSELRPELGTGFDALVARLLAKSPDERPEDASALLCALAQLNRTVSGVAPAVARIVSEQRIVSVVLGRLREEYRLGAARNTGDSSGIRTLTSALGTEPLLLRDGSVLVVLSDRGVATDHANQAAHCALLLRDLRPDLCFSVATGRAETTGRVPVGAAIDRAAELLDRAVRAEVTKREPALLNERSDSPPSPQPAIAMDALTAGLLDPRFDVQRHGSRLALVDEHTDAEATRLLMGKVSPFVGRDKELGLLELTLRECSDESVARLVLVTGPPGQGKSRLRHEFVARVHARADARVLFARADPVGAGSAFLLLRQLVRHAAGLREGAPPLAQRTGLRAYLDEVCEPTQAARIADFLGELLGLPAPEQASAELRASSDDPQLMNAWLRRSLGEWLASECAQRPLLLVLEDLHWGDQTSIAHLGDALRALATRPLMMLALARPEASQAFPELWVATERQEITLGRLTARAAERLVREALGGGLDASAVARVVQRADGNAFYLEELIRHVSEGEREGFPETVLSLVQSRLERLDPETRRIMRAASVFGEVFRPAGVAALLRQTVDLVDVSAALRALVAHEVCIPSWASGLTDSSEYSFRHSLLRDAAYGMLTHDDRVAAHALAGDWLERNAEQDALILANHFELGAQPKKAVPWLVQAAKLALDGGDLEASIPLSDRAFACGATGYARAALCSLRAAALHARGELKASAAMGLEALTLLPVGGLAWNICAANLFSTATYLGDHEVAGPLLKTFLSQPALGDPSGSYGWTVFSIGSGLVAAGELDLAEVLLSRAEALATNTASDAPSFLASLRITRAQLQAALGQAAAPMSNLLEACVLAERAEHVIYQIMSRLLLVAGYVTLGSAERAEASSQELLARCGPNNALRVFSDRNNGLLATARLNQGRVQEAMDLVLPLLDVPDRYLAVGSRAQLAHMLIATGDLNDALREANTALRASAHFPTREVTALSAIARIAYQRDQFDAAVATAERGLSLLARGHWLWDGSILRVVRAEALHALGRHDEARVAIRTARDEVLRVVDQLDDTSLAACYRGNIPANARTLVLADAWLREERV